MLQYYVRLRRNDKADPCSPPGKSVPRLFNVGQCKFANEPHILHLCKRCLKTEKLAQFDDPCVGRSVSLSSGYPKAGNPKRGMQYASSRRILTLMIDNYVLTLIDRAASGSAFTGGQCFACGGEPTSGQASHSISPKAALICSIKSGGVIGCRDQICRPHPNRLSRVRASAPLVQ